MPREESDSGDEESQLLYQPKHLDQQDSSQLDYGEEPNASPGQLESPLREKSRRQRDQPLFVKETHPLGLAPFPDGSTVPPNRLPAIKNFAKPADHSTQAPHDPVEKLVEFCICKARATSIDADNGLYIQCHERKCGKWFHQKCVDYEEPEDWRDGWLCADCGRPGEGNGEGYETEEEVAVREKPKRKKKKQSAKRKARA
ncbi:hypothetical protein LTR36_010285 [Oleoguttula mirabilis]|uniref:PHD-type domain-containing protein n=1 Tax=Oleoguttula mirabilis TaxID=1507867 RepID=A0AAV9J5H5_9PEZI|nr:hypothetical protein LTR36_010285 [Oleoguttula mirabilis]